MQFGLSIPHRGPLANPEAIRAIAESAERLGYGVLTISDHIVVPRQIASKYPYSPDGGWSGGGDGMCFEQISLLNYVAGITKKARLLTSIMVIPHREPIFTAKALATADQLSGGRVELGIGTGWMREEFELLKTEPFMERGAVTDEYIQAFKVLWTQENPSFDGKYVQFKDIFFEPKPIQPGGPKIWVGGESGRALRRLALRPRRRRAVGRRRRERRRHRALHPERLVVVRRGAAVVHQRRLEVLAHPRVARAAEAVEQLDRAGGDVRAARRVRAVRVRRARPRERAARRRLDGKRVHAVAARAAHGRRRGRQQRRGARAVARDERSERR